MSLIVSSLRPLSGCHSFRLPALCLPGQRSPGTEKRQLSINAVDVPAQNCNRGRSPATGSRATRAFNLLGGVNVCPASGSGGQQPLQNHVLCQRFHTACAMCGALKTKASLQECYSILGIERDCTDSELRDAYLRKVKAVHPDSGTDTASGQRFIQVKDAYKAVLEHRKGAMLEEAEEKEVEADSVFDIRHTAPQHRQYLEFEGVGFGSPAQRQRQYQQYRVERVTESVFQHRMRTAAADEDALVVKDKTQARKTIISNAVERLCEDLIQESMKRGEFDNLSGQGQPLKHLEHNPYIDTATHNINKILVNNGFAPEWIMLQGEIRKDLELSRQRIALTYKRVGPESLEAKEANIWTAAVQRFRADLREVNGKVDKYNMIVPFLDKQKIPYQVGRELKKITDDVEKFLPEETEENQAYVAGLDARLQAPIPLAGQEDISWRQVWRDIKNVFQTGERNDGEGGKENAQG